MTERGNGRCIYPCFHNSSVTVATMVSIVLYTYIHTLDILYNQTLNKLRLHTREKGGGKGHLERYSLVNHFVSTSHF